LAAFHFPPILLLILVAARARTVFEDAEVGSFLVAQVALVAITGAAVASRLSHVKTKGWTPQHRLPPGWGVVPNPCNKEHTKSVNSRPAELVG